MNHPLTLHSFCSKVSLPWNRSLTVIGCWLLTSIAHATEATPKGVAKSDWSSIRAAYEAGRHEIRATEGGHEARNPGQGWTTKWDGRGFLAQPATAGDGAWQWGLQLESYGFSGAEQPISGTAPAHAEGQRLSYQWDGNVQEWYVNDQRGVEHGFTVAAKPLERDGKDKRDQKDSPETSLESLPSLLSFQLSIRGGLHPELSGDAQTVRFLDAAGAAVVTYGGLKVWDADGKVLPSHFAEAAADSFRLLVDERGARYPLTVDPVAQQAYLKASNVDAGDGFGFSVAVSGDTVVVGARWEDSNGSGPDDNSMALAGAAYVFTRIAGIWSQQAYLKASHPGEDDWFGDAVAISGDTIVVGAFGEDSDGSGPGNNSLLDSGAAYVFTRSGGTWSQQAYLKASNPGSAEWFGASLGISGDTVVVGAPFENSNGSGPDDDSMELAGAAYVFTRNAGTWSQQAYLKASNAGESDFFGRAVTVSGNTVVIGAPGESSNGSAPGNNSMTAAGAAYVFTRNGGAWSEQTYLKASNPGTRDYFGRSMAISGNTVAVGAYGEDSGSSGINGDQLDNSSEDSGAVYVFARSGASWYQEAYVKGYYNGAEDRFGLAVGVSGETLVVGAPDDDSSTSGVAFVSNESASNAGAAYVLRRNAGHWTYDSYIKASNPGVNDLFGYALAIDGNTLIVGAPYEDGGNSGVNPVSNDDAADAGGSYVFEMPPPPTVTTLAATDITDTSAVLHGRVNGHGLDATVVFEALRLEAPLENRTDFGVPSTVTGTSAMLSEALFTGLLPATTYYFRVKGISPGGNVAGEYLTFTTAAAAPSTEDLVANFTSASHVPATAETYNGSRRNVLIALSYPPATGTTLTIVNQTGLQFMPSEFDNLPQGQAVTLSFGGQAYHFVADYFGGTGNDLVLRWADVKAMAWGSGSNGRLGDGTTTRRLVPTPVLTTGVLSGKTILSVSAGASFSYALCSDGTVAAWGYNDDGELGVGHDSFPGQLVPVALDQTGALSGKRVVAISAGEPGLALCSDGTVAAWGNSFWGSLGNGVYDRNGWGGESPVAVDTTGPLAGRRVIAVSSGGRHALVLCDDGTMVTWGINDFGQLGNGSAAPHSYLPVEVDQTGVLAGRKVVAVSAGSAHCLALCADGTLVTWGDNHRGELGINSILIAESNVPMLVDQTGVLASRTAVSITAGNGVSLVRCSDGSLVAWGQGDRLMLGIGPGLDQIAPVLVNTAELAGHPVSALDVGSNHALALTTDGRLAVWGDNEYGQLGTGDDFFRSVPVLLSTSTLAAGERFVSISAHNAGHNLALVATPPPSSGSIVTLPASDITSTSAVIHGTVNPHGIPTDVFFTYRSGLSPSGIAVTATPSNITLEGNTPVSATLRNLIPGRTYYYQVLGNNGMTVGTGETLFFTTARPTTIEEWRMLHFASSADAGDASNSADPDRDGLSNLLEFGFGLDPKGNSAGDLPQPVFMGTELVIEFTEPGIAGLTYEAEWSETMLPGSWESVFDQGNPPFHSFRLDTTGRPRALVRLKVTTNP